MSLAALEAVCVGGSVWWRQCVVEAVCGGGSVWWFLSRTAEEVLSQGNLLTGRSLHSC